MKYDELNKKASEFRKLAIFDMPIWMLAGIGAAAATAGAIAGSEEKKQSHSAPDKKTPSDKDYKNIVEIKYYLDQIKSLTFKINTQYANLTVKDAGWFDRLFGNNHTFTVKRLIKILRELQALSNALEQKK